MLSKLITMKQLGQFVSDHQPEKIIDESYVWWLIRQGQDIVISLGLRQCLQLHDVFSHDIERLRRTAENGRQLERRSRMATGGRPWPGSGSNRSIKPSMISSRWHGRYKKSGEGYAQANS